MTFVPWKTIKLGLHMTPDEYRCAIKSTGITVSTEADSMIAGISCSPEKNVDLVCLSVEDLDFEAKTHYVDICAKALELGLELCPAEVGPALRLQYLDQRSGESLQVAMEAMNLNDDGEPCIFCVEQGDRIDRALMADVGAAYSNWWPYHRFVFLLPRK